jgi:hypothetical protein
MKNYYLSLLFLFVNLYSFGQDKAVIKQQANIVAQATIKNDYATIIKYSHPSLIKMMGGRDKMLNVIKDAMEGMSSKGISIDSVWIGTPQKLFIAGKELHCLVPQQLSMKVPDGKLVSNSFLLAISIDKGANWTFLSLSNGINNKTITQLLPNFNQQLKIPEDSKPIFFED